MKTSELTGAALDHAAYSHAAQQAARRAAVENELRTEREISAALTFERDEALKMNACFRRLLTKAVEIIKGEYPKEQWGEYGVPEIEEALK